MNTEATKSKQVLEVVGRLRTWLASAHTLHQRLSGRARFETFMPGSLAPEFLRRSDEALSNKALDDVSQAASLLSSLAEENERLRSCVVSFLAPWAVRYADDFGLPKGHLHASHYDLLVECGARMDDFTRHPLTTHPAQPEGEGHE